MHDTSQTLAGTTVFECTCIRISINFTTPTGSSLVLCLVAHTSCVNDLIKSMGDRAGIQDGLQKHYIASLSMLTILR